MAWEYKRTENTFAEIPEGTHRVRIASAEKATSKNSGNDMLVLKMEVSGYQSHIWRYIAFLEDRPEITNRMLTEMFDSFDIDEGNFNLASYVGKVGAAVIKHDEQGRAKVSYFVKKDKQANLPAWKEPNGSPVAGFAPVENEDMPF